MADVRIAEDWKAILKDEFSKPYFEELVSFVRDEYAQGEVFPAGRNIFRAFDKCPFDKLRVVIIGQDWHVEHSSGEKLPIDKNDFSFTYQGEKIKFDFAYITIHGTPGENGILQGYFRLLNIPFSCCDVLQAALTFDKYACNNYLRSFGIRVANSIVLRAGESVTDEQVMQEIGLPCFIKPSVGGSSFGVTKVKAQDQIQDAIAKAFSEGEEVMIEAYMQGTEVTSGMYKTKDVTRIFPITEVVTDNEFFDYDAKYKDPNGAGLQIPADLSPDMIETIRSEAVKIYKVLDALLGRGHFLLLLDGLFL